MGLVRAEAARVAQRRRARLCRVLLVNETSIRRRHRYVTVVACGDSGKILAMIPGRTKGSMSRFFRDQGPRWCRQVEIGVTVENGQNTTISWGGCSSGGSRPGMWCERGAPALCVLGLLKLVWVRSAASLVSCSGLRRRMRAWARLWRLV